MHPVHFLCPGATNPTGELLATEVDTKKSRKRIVWAVSSTGMFGQEFVLRSFRHRVRRRRPYLEKRFMMNSSQTAAALLSVRSATP